MKRATLLVITVCLGYGSFFSGGAQRLGKQAEFQEKTQRPEKMGAKSAAR
jgi:hypothetical protein